MITFLLIAAVLVGLFFAFSGSTPKEEMSPARSRPVHADLPEVRAAIHESGHVISNWCCTLVSQVKSASIGSGGDGRVQSIYLDLQTPSAKWCHLVIDLAGPAAEAMVYARGRNRESQRDLLSALKYAEAIGTDEPPWPKTEGRTLDFSRLYKTPPSDAALRNLKEGYRMARRILRLNEMRVYRVASLLLAKKKISQVDLKTILGSRLRVRLLMPFGAKFVLPREGKV